MAGVWWSRRRNGKGIRCANSPRTRCDRDFEVLNWVRKKTESTTGLERTNSVHPELRRVIDATPSNHLTFLVT